MDEAKYLEGLPDEVRNQFETMPEHEKEVMRARVQQATEHHENVIVPMLAFQYPARPYIPAAGNGGFQYRTFEFEAARLVDGKIRTTTQSAKYFVEVISEDVLLEMVHTAGGTFTMGSSDNSDSTVSSAAVSAFHIGKFEVTQRQWKAVMQHNLSAHKGEDLPVENVSWLDANEFCERLSMMTGRQYRLPSEAEWEYACRAGTTTRYSFGDEISTQVANYWDIEDLDETNLDDEPITLQTKPVGSFYPNDFGLYDMHGNVYELCQDIRLWDAADGGMWPYGEAPELVVIKGGSCDYYADNCRSAYREETMPNYRYGGTGFRVVCSVD